MGRFVHICWYLFIVGALIFVHVCWYLLIFVYIWWSVSISVDIYSHLFIFVYIYWYLIKSDLSICVCSVYICWYSLIFVYICWYLFILLRCCSYLFICVDNCLYLLICVHICLCLFTFLHICSYLLLIFVHSCWYVVHICLYLFCWYSFVFVDWPHSRPITIIAYLCAYPYVLYCIILIFIDFDLCLIDLCSWLCSADWFGLPCDAFHIVFT